MEVQQLKIEPEDWHHRFDISVVSKMLNDQNVINIEMMEMPKILKKESEILSKEQLLEDSEISIENKQSDLDGSIWL